MTKRATTRRERVAAREAAARHRRMLAWTLPGLIVAVGAVTAGVLLVDGQGGDEPDLAASQLDLGEEVFQSRCATCHGDDLRGTFVGPPLIHELYAPDVFPDDGIREAIANGVPAHNWDSDGMPPVSGLSRDDVEAVIRYVRSMQHAGGLGAVTTPSR
jgi:mono/diheme cytochrome c family protein